jgi:hypothetical protein
MSRKKHFKKGDRVEHAWLGSGTVLRANICCRVCDFVLVALDTTPTTGYKKGENPVLVLPKYLRVLMKEEATHL